MEMVVLAFMVVVLGQMVLLEPVVGLANPAAMMWPLSCIIVNAIQKVACIKS